MNHAKQDKNRNKNQHYVPENYFLEFSKDGLSVCGLFKKTGKAQANIQFGGQSSSQWFYGDAGREDEITKFDTKYCKNRREVLKELLGSSPNILPEQIEMLLESTQFQWRRTLSFREAEKGVREFYEDFFAPQVEALDSYDSGVSKEVTDALNDAMRLVFKSFSDPKDSQFFNLIFVNTEEVSDLKFIFLKNSTSRPFVFSDAPVVYSNPALKNFKCSKMSNNSVGLQIFYPLNSDFMVIFYDGAVYEFGNSASVVYDVINEADVDQINKLQLHEAVNSIYFRDSSDLDYVRKLWEEEEVSFKSRAIGIVSALELTADGYETGVSRLSKDESDPVFYPALSFVTEDLSKSSIPYRKAYWRKTIPEGIDIPKLNDLIDLHSPSPNEADDMDASS